MSDVVDLDALIPQPVTIKFGGAEIQVPPPKTADILRLGFLGQKMEKAGELPPEQLDQLVGDLTAQVYKCVPALDGKELTTAQLMKLIQIISEAGMPGDVKAMNEKGITPDSPKAK